MELTVNLVYLIAYVLQLVILRTLILLFWIRECQGILVNYIVNLTFFLSLQMNMFYVYTSFL